MAGKTRKSIATNSLIEDNEKMDSSGKKLYALVQWVGGEDDGLYSADIPVEYIKRFNYEEFQRNLENSADDDDFTYVVEWRDKKKPPKGGWKVYNCILRKVSSNKAVLQRELEKYNGTASFSKNLEHTEVVEEMENENLAESASALNGSEKENKNGKKVPSKGQTELSHVRNERRKSESDSDDTEINETVSLSGQATNFIVEALTKLLKSSRERDQMIQDLAASVSDLTLKSNILIDLLNGEPDAVRKIQNDISGPKFEIGKQGSGIFVNQNQWGHINSRESLGSLSVALVKALFTEEVLLRSNLKGGKNKIIKKPMEDEKYSAHEEHHDALDPNILGAIYDHVEMKFPIAFKRVLVGQAINQFLGRLRREVKGKVEKTFNMSQNISTTEKK